MDWTKICVDATRRITKTLKLAFHLYSSARADSSKVFPHKRTYQNMDVMPRSVKVEDTEILEAFDHVSDPIRTAPKMADDLDIGEDGLRKRLKTLEDRDLVKSKTVGARSVVWWRAD